MALTYEGRNVRHCLIIARKANRLEVGSEFYYVRRRFGFRGTDVEVDASQLVLAVDVSGSVNQTRFELQRQGYVSVGIAS